MYRINILIKNAVCLTFFFFLGCTKHDVTTSNNSHMIKLTDNEWIKLSEKRIFFGHHSVGKNIIDGITDLSKEYNMTTLIINQSINKSDFGHPVFAHSPIGKNGDPISKIDDFVRILDSGVADSVDIAFMKLCYVDIKLHTDIEEIFRHYQNSIRTLQKKYPHLKIIHLTVPLTTKPKGIKGLARIILNRDENKHRNKFNELVRNAYADVELVDIAKIESTFPANASNVYWFNTPGLIPEYSSDGRHLNELGRSLVAYELLKKILISTDSVN